MSALYIGGKQRYHLWLWCIFLALSCLIVICGWYGYHWYTTGQKPPLIPVVAADTRIDESDISQTQVDNYTVPALHPRYISIPALHVDKVRVQEVGVTSTNELDTPKNINDTAWYSKSATPGSGVGAVLIDGHNGGITKDGVFAKLNTLKNGDKIIVERGDGKKFTYSVTENQSMSLEEVNSTGMKMMMKSSEPDKEGLSLITCDGKWVPKYQQFDRRIMLRAILDK